jgi:hypothetical protein
MKNLLESLIYIFIGLCLMSCECEDCSNNTIKTHKAEDSTHKVEDANSGEPDPSSEKR